MTLHEKLKSISTAPWGGNTDLIKTYSIILERAKLSNLPSEEMPTQIIMISDMQFDKACLNNSVTNFEKIDEMYRQSGYPRPKLIFWNVASNILDFPATNNLKNCALISGFSTSVFKSLITTTTFSPINIMFEVIYGSRYQLIYNRLLQC